MKKMFLVFSIVISCFSLGACSSSEEEISIIEVEFAPTASMNDDDKLVVSGTTNLPDSTSLLISLKNEATGFLAQSKTSIFESRFVSEPLGPKTGISDGAYNIQIIMPNPKGQAESVRKLIGNEGEYLSGRLVTESSFGFNVVDFNFNVNVGSNESIEKSKVEHEKIVQDINKKVSSLINQGMEMENLRSSGNIQACMEKMRKLQPEATDLRDISTSLPLKYMSLKTAVIESYSCVSCSKSANEACIRANQDLEQFEI